MNTFTWLSRLIACDTTSYLSNLELIDVVADWFTQHDVTYRITHDSEERKANLFATLPDVKGRTDGGLVLSGHTDCVPVTGQEWHTHPFTATQIKDKIYGRGACDMKGFLAVILALLPEFQQLPLESPVHFAFTYDEEVGCKGARLLLDDLKKAGIKPMACIVGEPTSMRPVVAHKGIQVFRCVVRGRAAHSSLTPEGVNAIEYAARLIAFVRQLADQCQRGPLDTLYDVPYTTLSTNTIQGGIAHNTIPDLCECIIEMRYLPEINPKTIIDQIELFIVKELLPKMRKEHPMAAIQLDPLNSIPSFASTEKSDIRQLIFRISGEKDTLKVAYATEAGFYQAYDIPTIICGPGSIKEAHRADEFVTVKSLKQCADFLLRVVSALPGSGRIE